MGAVLWHAPYLANTRNLSLEGIATLDKAMVLRRYPSSFSPERSINCIA
jgi:hypothetical protein